MTTQIDVATNMLFPSDGVQTANIKFFRGWSRPINSEQIAAQFVAVEAQIASGAIQASDGIDD